MKMLLHVFLTLLPFSVFANSENNDFGIIRGIVTTVDGFPAAYVSVFIKSTGKGTMTDANGNFELKKIKSGKYDLHFSLSGYIDSAITVEVSGNETVFLKVQLRPSYAELKKVIVDGKIQEYVETKTSESLRMSLPIIEVPQNIIVISHQLLADQGAVSITQAIRNVSGVQKFYGELNDYSLNIRGTDATNNIFRNGVGGLWWNQQEDVAMVEKIEFVKGPAGFLSSQGEPGGVVNIVTKQPSKAHIASVEGGFGSFNLIRLAVDLGGPLTKSAKFYYRFNAGVHHQERAFQYGKAIRYFICPTLKYEFNKKTSLTAEYSYVYGKTSGNNDGLPSVNGEMFQLPRDFAVADPATDEITAYDTYYRIHLKHDFNENWHLNIQAASVQSPWEGYNLHSDGENPISNDTLYRVSAYYHYINYANPAYAYIDGKFHSGRRFEHNVLLGFDYHNDGSKGSFGGAWGGKKFGLYIPKPDYYVNVDSLRNFEIFSGGHFKGKSIGLYIQDHIKIAGKLVVTLAGRLTHATTSMEGVDWVPDDQKRTKDNVFTPRAGLTWLFGDKASVYALYDQCFLTQTGRSFEMKPIKPLTGYNIETGLKSYFFNKKLILNFSIFDIVKNNMLIPDPLHDGFQIQRGQIVSKGIDFDITGNITPYLLVNANYEYVNAKVTKDSDPNVVGTKNFGTPDHHANLWLQYKMHGAFKGFSFSVGSQYLSKRSAVWYYWVPDKTKYLPGYNLLDAGLGFSNERFNVILHFYNIINIDYASTGYFNFTSNDWKYTPGEPVNFRLNFGINLLHKKGV